MTPPLSNTAITPPQLAKLWGIDPAKVLTWIRSGELSAFNGAASTATRPRYLITQQAIEDFQKRRAVSPVLV